MEIGDYVEVFDSGIRRMTPGVILNIKVLEGDKSASYLVSTDSDTFWHPKPERLEVGQPDLSKILEPNCLVLREEDLPSWAIQKSIYEPGSWEFIGWTEFFRKLKLQAVSNSK